MQSDIQTAKDTLRKQIRAVLRQIPLQRRESDSRRLRSQLKEQSFFRSANSILFFAPLSNEIDIWPLLEESLVAGKITALPRFDSISQSYVACRVQDLLGEIVTGQFGIREPGANCDKIQPGNLDLILVPSVAFDLCGHRLGRGQGFYDQLLAGARGVKCGVAFDEQIAEEVPVGPLDVRMDFILTPTRCVKCDK